MIGHTFYKMNPPRPTLEESRWRVRSNETPLGPSWSNWYIDVVKSMAPTILTDTDLNQRRDVLVRFEKLGVLSNTMGPWFKRLGELLAEGGSR